MRTGGRHRLSNIQIRQPHKKSKSPAKQKCTNNQADHLAIVITLEYTENLQIEDKTATIYTGSRMTLDSLKNCNIRSYVFEEIRRKLIDMRKTNWKIQFSWVKAHVGFRENELADTLVKEITTNMDIKECYKKN